PAEEQSRVRVQLAACLQGVIAQRLLPRREGGRVLASEVLIATHAVRNLVRAGNIYQLQTVMESGRSRGMQTLEQSLRLLRETGTLEEQLGATDPDGGWAAGRLERWAHAGEDIPLPGS
ncbi:MAG: type IV pilus twitching motility protein PilT, partial [Syntrophomonadaceae bacterium]|nr:type IV pilus twitching motility protein PilT [Syntrophomonadaceae bacterium]